MPTTPSPNAAALDNPVWHSLAGLHQPLADSLGDACWYPSTVAPFMAVPSAECRPDLDGAFGRGFCDPAYFVGVIPHVLPEGWLVSARSFILQMLPAGSEQPESDDDDIQVLGIADRPSMLALSHIAFPDYFRERTAELGTYLGIFAGGRLVAMAGERLAVGGLQEISGVCTQPDFGGRGYARRLTQALMRRHRQRGVGSFLHVSEANAAARRLYDSMGFDTRAALPMAKIERIDRGGGSRAVSSAHGI
jgi:ribosomal protein S18 acetylase RimI-like enzyme